LGTRGEDELAGAFYHVPGDKLEGGAVLRVKVNVEEEEERGIDGSVAV
jgi:hypothetical protein